MKNILLPTDFSKNSWNAIEYAINFYKDTPCNFYLLNVGRESNLVVNDSPYIPNKDVLENLILKPSKQKLKQFLKQIREEFPKNKKHNFYTLVDYNFFIDSFYCLCAGYSYSKI